MPNYTEFTCRSGGSNLYAGTLDGSTEASTTPLVTYTNGGWVSGTRVFTPASGNPVSAGVTVGQWVSVYVDAAAAPTNYVALVAAVSSTTITLSTTERSGTVPTTSASGVTLVVGGAWAGMSGTNAFPWTFMTSTMATSGTQPRVNVKNDQTYTISATFTASANGPFALQGYTSSFGDGGKFTLQTSGTASFSISISQNQLILRDCRIIMTSFTSGTAGVTFSGARQSLERVVVADSRTHGLLGSSTMTLYECEVYSWGRAGATYHGFNMTGSSTLVRCIAHDQSGSGGHGFFFSANMSAEECIADTCHDSGFYVSGNINITLDNCVSYNNGDSGLYCTTGNSSVVVENCVFISNGGYGAYVLDPQGQARFYKCGFYSNTSGAAVGVGVVSEFDTVTLTGNPFVDAANGDFRLNSTAGAGAACRGAGRGAYTQTASSYAGTVGYPDIGAVQHQDAGGGGTSGARLVGPSCLVTPGGCMT